MSRALHEDQTTPSASKRKRLMAIAIQISTDVLDSKSVLSSRLCQLPASQPWHLFIASITGIRMLTSTCSSKLKLQSPRRLNRWDRTQRARITLTKKRNAIVMPSPNTILSWLVKSMVDPKFGSNERFFLASRGNVSWEVTKVCELGLWEVQLSY